MCIELCILYIYNTYICIESYMYIYTHIYVCMHTNTQTHKHTHTHTHTLGGQVRAVVAEMSESERTAPTDTTFALVAEGPKT